MLPDLNHLLINSCEAKAAVIGDIEVFYKSKILNCVAALSFLRSAQAFFVLFTCVRSQIRAVIWITLK